MHTHYHVFSRSLNTRPRSVPKAIPGRDSMEVEIFGMAGVPPGMKPGTAAGEPSVLVSMSSSSLWVRPGSTGDMSRNVVKHDR
jgi:hypothetical protein